MELLPSGIKKIVGSSNQLIVLSLLMLLLVTGCGGGSSDGAAVSPIKITPLESLATFPVNQKYQWFYNNSVQPVSFEETLSIANHEIVAMRHPTGANEYYHTSSEELYYFGVYIPSITVQTPAGIRSYTGDVKLNEPIILYSKSWTPDSSFSFTGSGNININPTYGDHAISYDGSLTYLGMESVSVPLATYQAHHIRYTFTVSTTIEGQQFTIPFSTEIWLAEDYGIVKRVESGFQFQLTSLSGLPNQATFTASEGAKMLPIARQLSYNSQPVVASAYTTDIVYDGSTQGWLTLTNNNTDDRYILQPNTTNLTVGEYTATINFNTTTLTSFSTRVVYKVEPPTLVTPSSVSFNLLGNIDFSNLSTALSLQSTGRPVSINISSSADWIKIIDKTTNPDNPDYQIQLSIAELYSRNGTVNESIHITYNNGYTGNNLIIVPVEIHLPASGISPPQISFFNVSGNPNSPQAIALNVFGNALNADDFQVSIDYTGVNTNWLSIITDPNTKTLHAETTRSDLAPGLYIANVTLTSSTGNDIPITVEFRVYTPELIVPTSLAWTIDETTSLAELTNSIAMQHTGELLNWTISSTSPIINATQISNDFVNGGLADVTLDKDAVGLMTNGQFSEAVTITYSGQYVGSTQVTIPVYVTLEFPVIQFPLPYVLYEGRPGNVTLNGSKLLPLASSQISIGNTPITDFTVIDDNEISANVPALPAGEYFLNITNALGVARPGGRVVVMPSLNYADDIINVPGRVESIVYDEERQAFFVVFWSLNYGTKFNVVRIQYQVNTWVTQNIAIPNPLAVTLSPDGSDLLVTTEDCTIKHVNPTTLSISQPYPGSNSCYYDRYGMISAFNDGQILVADTNQWPTVWSYPDFVNQSYPSIHNPISILSLKRNKMLWAESPSITGPRDLFIYDAKTDTYSFISVISDSYFLRHYISLDADGSRIMHFKDVYDSNLNYIGSLDTLESALSTTQPTPDGMRAVMYEYQTSSISLFDISGNTGPFPKIGQNITLPTDSISTIQDIMIPFDGSVVFMFGMHNTNNNTAFKLVIRNLP